MLIRGDLKCVKTRTCDLTVRLNCHIPSYILFFAMYDAAPSMQIVSFLIVQNVNSTRNTKAILRHVGKV